MLQREEGRASTTRDAHLCVAVLQMAIDRLGRDIQPIADLPDRHPSDSEAQHLDFSSAQPPRPANSSVAFLLGRRCYGTDRAGVQRSRLHFLL